MDDFLDKLKVLNYENAFCKSRNLQPLNRFYFVVAATNPNEQFYYLTNMFSWLLEIIGQRYDTPEQFDDPNATAANMVSELKKAGIAFEYGPLKLKQAFGEGVIYALQALAEKALKSKGIVFKLPIHKSDDYAEDAEVDVQAEVTTDFIEEEVFEDDEDTPFIDVIQKSTHELDKPASELPLVPVIDPSEWKLEVERVSPSLKVEMPNDNRDWRVHLEQMTHHKETISRFLGESEGQLKKIHVEIEKTLEKINSREKYINTQFEPAIEKYKTIQLHTSELKQRYNIETTKINALTNELSFVSEELDAVKSRMDDIGTGMTDSKPLINIKQGVLKLKSEIKNMDLRIGVIEHTLMQAKLKNKGKLVNSETSAFQILA